MPYPKLFANNVWTFQIGFGLTTWKRSFVSHFLSVILVANFTDASQPLLSDGGNNIR
jgi:hypothetical protein